MQGPLHSFPGLSPSSLCLNISDDWELTPLESTLSIMGQFGHKKPLPFLKWKTNLRSLPLNGPVPSSGAIANRSNSSSTD